MDIYPKAREKMLEVAKALEKQDQKALTALFQLNSPNAVHEVRVILDEKPDIFTTLCQYGLYDILEYLLGNLPLDINRKSNGMTGLQYACKEGHTDIVDLLLKIGAKLNENLWEEQSEFYLASLHGHYDILHLLLRENPDLLEDSSKCYCLFHGACRGGHVGMMQKWLRPDMDVNTEVAYVSSLNECENQFPLYAVCNGNHMEAAEFLIGDLKATITKKICDVFPEFISKVVRNLFKTSNLGKRMFIMRELDLECVLPMWFEITDENDKDRRSSDILDELEIDLSKNKLSKLPAKLLWEMTDLIHLCVSHNPLNELPQAPSNASLQLNSLASLDLSYCKLERLNNAIFCLQNLKRLTASHNYLEELYENSDAPCKWKCKLLKELDLSHNVLRHLPNGIQECTDLEYISVCYNLLTIFCPPWQCPLKTLDISNNKINSFPPSADHFWAKTLKKLNASHNLLDQIPESVVKMKCLSHLNMSNNKISSIPDSLLWLCPLASLNLSHNELGSTMGHSTTKTIVSIKRSRKRTVLTLPGSILKSTLTELDLSHNDLLTLPEGICDLVALSFMDLSFNKRLTSLPLEVGKLKNLIVLELKGIKLQDKEIQEAVNDMDDPKKKCLSASEFVKFMERKRRKCRHHDVIKMVVFGCKNLGDQCVVRKLISESTGSDCRPQGSYHVTLEVADLTLRYARKHQTRCKRNIQFRIWEMPDIKLTSTVHPCFLTQNSLYLLVHDVSSLHEDIHKVSSQILAIQSCVTLPSIIVVGLFPALMDPEYKQRLRQSLETKFIAKFKCEFVAVSFSDKTSWEDLRQKIYVTACGMPDSSFRKSFLIDREVPESFVLSYEKIRSLKLPIYDMEQFTQETGLKSSDFNDKIGDKFTLHEYLLQVGAMLHYDVQMSDLTNFVILDPSWLFDLLYYFLKNFVVEGHKQAKMYCDEVEKFMQEKIEDKFFKPFISLLEFSNIAIQISESQGKESLLIPSLLSKQSQFLVGEDNDSSLKTSRFYPLPAVPASLWSHVISRLISAIDRFSNPTWKFEDLVRQSSICDSSQSLRKTQTTSARGLHVLNKGLHYWRTGIHIWHDQGSVVVEQVKYQPKRDICSEGILITAKTTKHARHSNPSEEMSSKTDNLKKLAIIGIVKDELEEVLELFHPKFHDPLGSNSRPMALCPNCYNIKPGVGIIQEEIDHFYVRDCAQRILWESHAFCNDAPVLLDQLMPELLFLELPSNFVIAPSDLEMTSVNLGHGMAGTVTKGYYKKQEVAVKVFHHPMYEPAYLKTDNDNYPNIGLLSKLELSSFDQDQNDTEQRKISNAFSDIRREVGILSKLKHKCIIAFIGVCVRRQVVLIMELAPCGSLRSQLEKTCPVQKSDEVEEDITITSSVFGKDLTYKIILQVSSGLSYLHKNHIIFRDLKPDNILVMSMDANVAINVKLSDYGISKFSTPQGVSGLIGTIAYMAPEVIAKQAYTNKIDIYSLGLVMFEILTGIPPPSNDNKPMASQKNLEFDICPIHVKRVTLNVNFLPLETLMSKCWSYYKEDRPEANSIVKMLKSDTFMILHDAVWLPYLPTQDIYITCTYSCKSLGRWTLWISESARRSSSLQDRFMSVYDLQSSRFSVWRKKIPGLKITHMAKVGNKIWMSCEGSKQLEELVRGKENKLEIKAGHTLDDMPTTLLCHRIVKNEKEDHLVLLVGQENGSITTFSFSDSSQRTLMMMTSLILDSKNAVSNIITVRENLIIASCGFWLFFLDVQKEIICQQDVHLLLSIQSTFSCFQDLNIKEPVLSLSSQDESIWCIFKDTNLLIKLDCESKEVLESVVFTWEPSRDQVRAEQTSVPFPFSVGRNSKSLKLSEARKCKSITEMDEEVFVESTKGKSATLPAYMGKLDHNSGTYQDDNIYLTPIQDIHPEGQEAVNDRAIPEDTEECLTLHNNSTSYGLDSTEEPIYETFMDVKPPLPPRSRLRTSKTFNPLKKYQPANLNPPSIPRKFSNPEDEVELTAICICSDLLAVGCNCGGFVLIPIRCTEHLRNKKQIIFPSQSVQYPVLRHPPHRSLKNPVTSSKISTSTSKKGFISNFFVAEEMLISLYMAEDRDILTRSKLSRRRIEMKRLGRHLSIESGGSSETVGPSAEGPNASNKSEDSSNDAKMAEDKERETELPNIVVWGDLSSERLETISSYGRNLEN